MCDMGFWLCYMITLMVNIALLYNLIKLEECFIILYDAVNGKIVMLYYKQNGMLAIGYDKLIGSSIISS